MRDREITRESIRKDRWSPTSHRAACGYLTHRCVNYRYTCVYIVDFESVYILREREPRFFQLTKSKVKKRQPHGRTFLLSAGASEFSQRQVLSYTYIIGTGVMDRFRGWYLYFLLGRTFGRGLGWQEDRDRFGTSVTMIIIEINSFVDSVRKIVDACGKTLSMYCKIKLINCLVKDELRAYHVSFKSWGKISKLQKRFYVHYFSE